MAPSGALDGPDPVTTTEAWLRDFVIALDLCPFAAGPFRAGQVRVVASRGDGLEECLAELLGEAQLLDQGQEGGASTTLFVVPQLGLDFEELLDLVDLGEALLEQEDLDASVQLVGFHPDYLFADAEPEDPANATNRSPFPMVHLLRRDDVARAIAGHPDVDGIPAHNVRVLRERAEG